MPLYEFRCRSCGPFDAVHTMADVPQDAPCPRCGGRARRAVAAPALGRGAGAAMRLLDATARTAAEPGVVTGAPPGRRRARGTPVSADPVHRTLPRP